MMAEIGAGSAVCKTLGIVNVGIVIQKTEKLEILQKGRWNWAGS